MAVQGVIQRIGDRQFNGKTFYSFALSGQEGWYGTGVKRPPEVGKSVRFNEKTNSKGYKEVDGSIEILADGQTGPAANPVVIAKAAGGGANNSGAGDISKDAYWRGKENRDLTNDAARELGASRNTAIAFIDLALKNEVIKLPAAAKREEFLWTLLDKYTGRLMGKNTDAPPEETVSSSTREAQDDPQAGSDDWS